MPQPEYKIFARLTKHLDGKTENSGEKIKFRVIPFGKLQKVWAVM